MNKKNKNTNFFLIFESGTLVGLMIIYEFTSWKIILLPFHKMIDLASSLTSSFSISSFSPSTKCHHRNSTQSKTCPKRGVVPSKHKKELNNFQLISSLKGI